MIDLVYKTVQTILAKDRNGLVTPEEFNNLSKLVQDTIFRGYFEDENKDKLRENRGLTNSGYSNLAFNERQRIDQFAATTTVSYNAFEQKYELPSDLYFLEDDGVLSEDDNVIEEVERYRRGYLKSSISAPTATYPVYERFSDYIEVSPTTITTDISIRYLRKPLDPKWTYTVVGGSEMFDISNPSYQDFDLHVSEFNNLVIRILSFFSINIKDIEVTQIAETFKDKQSIKEGT
jgi:hypothetical protein